MAETEGTVRQRGNDDVDRPRLRSEDIAASSSSNSCQSDPSHRLSFRRPDGNSVETGPSDLKSLERVLRKESIVDVIEVAPLTVPSTPVRDNIDIASHDVKGNLELASERLSKLSPTD
ncbi:uncharacterized protein [Physcomitrium patens]|uniref:Uncharacterized protein n=1 Tax=Physcomitrium patens TaxID=3218 RepID=A9S9C4_PHYPA|nr:hypothetical protein PHYPA_013590 [Physcomitrium patens]